MTAVDHAELKRVAEGAKERAAVLRRLEALSEVADALEAMANGSLSALSEIEGLKAERDTWKAMAENGASGIVAHIERAAEAERQLAVLRTQAPDSWRPIETAPKDGSRVLLYSVANEVPGLRPHIADGYWRATTGLMAPGFWSLGQSVGPSFCPTHWMPLPAAPVLRPQTAESGK